MWIALRLNPQFATLDGAFTEANNLGVLRNALREVGQKEMGVEVIKDVLILEIARQDY